MKIKTFLTVDVPEIWNILEIQKTEKTEYLSNQLTFAHLDQKFIFPMKFGTSEQIFIFLDFQNVSNFWNSYC